MSSLTSGKTRHDPLPWALHLSGGETYRSAERERLDYDYEPRPEFDNHNPILEAFREYVRWFGDDDGAEAAGRAEECASGALDTFYSPAHIAHARRVLSKLAALAN